MAFTILLLVNGENGFCGTLKILCQNRMGGEEEAEVGKIGEEVLQEVEEVGVEGAWLVAAPKVIQMRPLKWSIVLKMLDMVLTRDSVEQGKGWLARMARSMQTGLMQFLLCRALLLEKFFRLRQLQ